MRHRRAAHAHHPKPAMYLLLFTLLLATLLLAQFAAPTSAQGVASDLGDAETFGLLADTLTTPEPAGTTTVNGGDAGAVTATGTVGTPDGTFYVGAGTEYNAATASLEDAIAAANAQTPTLTLDADLGGKTLLPGVYDSTGAVEIGSDPLTLSGNGVFIFQISGTFDMAAGTTVVLQEGAQECNVFWVPGGATTLAANTHFRGNLLMDSAATTVGITTMISGRILSQGAVTFSGPGPSEIHVPQACDPVEAPALSIDKEAAQDSVTVGDTVNYSVTVTNTGNVTLTDVTLSDTFDPDHFTFVEVIGVAALDISLPGEVSWDHGTLEPDEAVTYNLSFTADTATAEGGSANTAVAFSAEHDLQVEDTASVVITAPIITEPEEEPTPPEEEPVPLPVTGGNTLMMLLLGTLLAAAGFGLWLFSRTRNV